MKNKKLLLLILALFTPLLFLAACGDNNSGTADTPAPTDAPATTAPSAADDEPLEIIEISFWHAMTGVHGDAVDTLVAAFNEEFPHIQINAEFQGNYGDLRTLVNAAAISGDLPHLSQPTTDDVTTYMNDGIIVPLTSFFNHPEYGLTQDEINDIIPVFREGVIWDGEFMSVPFGKSTRVLFYNVDLFEEYDVEVPATWDELIEVSRVLTDVDANRFGMGLENGWAAEFMALVLQHGGEYIDEATATAMFGEQPGIDAASMLMEMVEGEYARFAGEDGFLSGVFGNGFVAMYIGSSAGFPHVEGAVDGDFEWMTAPVPLHNGNAASRFQGNDLVLFDNGASEAEQLAAWQFMRFTMRPEVQAQWAADTGYIPVSFAAAAHPIFTSFLEENPNARAASEQFDAGFMTARVTGADQVWVILGEALTDIRLGVESIEDALAEGQRRANEALGN